MKGALGMALAARGHQDGRALRSAMYRHRRLVDKPLAVVLWQLGSEPFSASAMAWGTNHDQMHMCVAGDPRNREMAFSALLKLAKWFNPRFSKHADKRDVLISKRSQRRRERAKTAPQILVANNATVGLLGRLGRRLAYLPTDGERPADPALPLLGRHLQFLDRHTAMAGQQLIVPLDQLVRDHWVSPQSAFERASLAALDAFIKPPRGKHGFAAAAAAELHPIGPIPGDEDDGLETLFERLDGQRAGSTDARVLAPLLRPIEDHYRPLIQRTWDLLWRGWARERAFEEAPSVQRRWDADRDEYTRHISFVDKGFRRRARESARQAAERLRRLETAQQLLATEEACDDPVRMIPYLLDHKAVAGRVVGIDRSHKVQGLKRMVVRPLITLRTEEPCLMPPGKTLYWSEMPGGASFEVMSVTPTTVVLLCASPNEERAPSLQAEACFSVMNMKEFFPPPLPGSPPWTHEPRVQNPPGDIEEPGAAQ